MHTEKLKSANKILHAVAAILQAKTCDVWYTSGVAITLPSYLLHAASAVRPLPAISDATMQDYAPPPLKMSKKISVSSEAAEQVNFWLFQLRLVCINQVMAHCI